MTIARFALFLGLLAVVAGCEAGKAAPTVSSSSGSTGPPEQGPAVSAPVASVSNGGAGTGPFQVPGDAEAGKKIARAKCKLCHKVDGQGGVMGPAMDGKYYRFLHAKMSEYPDWIAELKIKHKPIYQARQADIEAVLATEDPERKLYTWLKHYIPHPTFDRPPAKMKPVVLTDQQLEDVIAYVFSLEE